MSTSLITPAQWAQMEFALVQLGDQRRTKRLINIATKLAANPGGTLPQAFGQWDELKAAYRFFSQPRNSREQILAPHLERTLAQCRQPGEYLLIEDTSDLDYSHHPITEQLGVIGDGRGRGLRLHSTLALRVEAWNLEQRPEAVVVGLMHQQCWAQKTRPQGRGRYQPGRKRASERWAAVFQQAGGPPTGSRWIYIADRESDFNEPIRRCQQHGVDFVIRACHDRCLANEEAHLWEWIAQAPVLGQLTVPLRARPGQAARTAIVEVRSASVRLHGTWRPGGPQPDLELNVVQAQEVDAPPGVEPLHWILLTSLPCATLTQARRVIGCYIARWHIEEYHKALKSGAGVEESQLEQAYRLESLIAVLAIVAVRLFNSKLLARACPDEPLDQKQIGSELLLLLATKFGQPKEGWTNRSYLVAVARLGGFIGRKSDGLPGWQTIWRGWRRLIWMAQGLETLSQAGGRCG